MSQALYIYAVLPSNSDVSSLPVTGIAGGEIRVIAEGPVACLVSEIDGQKLRPTRGNLSAHHRVMQALIEHADSLPTAFGTMADSEQDAREMLSDHAEDFLDGLDRIRGCVEMALAVSWDAGGMIEHVVAHDPELQHARTMLLKNPSHDTQMQVGRMLEAALTAWRERVGDSITPILETVSAEVISEPTRGDAELARLACLVPKANLAAFDLAVEEAATRLDDNYIMSVSGPFACQSFIDVELSVPQNETAGS